MTGSIIALAGVTKRFGDFVANNAIDLRVQEGAIHAIVGENGAGKSTLMKTLAGIHIPEEGSIILRGQEITLRSPEVAMANGIAMVHQHFSLVPSLTTTENIIISNPPRRFGVLLHRRAIRLVAELSRTFGLEVNPHQRVADCSVGMQQRVEILKALYRAPDVLILDEPTAVLTPQETAALMDNLRSLRERGKTIIFITHKLKEVMAIADRVTVMRAGRVVLETDIGDTDPQALAAAMIGRDMEIKPRAASVPTGAELARLEAVSCGSDTGSPSLDNVSLSIRQGEIIGVAGVEGNGQSELIEVLTGMRRPRAGRIYLQDLDVTARVSPDTMRKCGVAHIPEDRITTGLATSATLTDNLIMGAHGSPEISSGPWIRRDAARNYARQLVRDFDIRPGNIDADAESLSGGNMQKAIIARELSGEPRIIVAAHPTRGVDIGAAEFVYDQLIARRDKSGVLLVSSDLDEILRLSDRVVVMYQGRFVAEAVPRDLTPEKLGLLMAGVVDDAPAEDLGEAV